MHHYSYYIILVRGILLFAGLIAFISTGASATLSDALALRFNGSMIATVPAYWFFLSMGASLLIFPLSIIEEHYARVRGDLEDETPIWHWLQSLGLEIIIVLVLGTICSAVMIWQPALWWMYLTAAWLTYHIAVPAVQSMSLLSDDQEEDQYARRPELLAELKSSLAHADVDLIDVRALPDEDELPHLPVDMYLAGGAKNSTLFIPSPWIATWTMPELIAVALHKVAMERNSMQIKFGVMRLLQALIAFGGFAILFPWLQQIGWVTAPGNIKTIPFFILWITVALSLFKPAANAFTRLAVLRADDHVLKWMSSNEGIIAALNRARSEFPEEQPMPRWMDLLFVASPGLSYRIDRLQKSNA